ncbi:histidine kinase [Sphingobacterium corticis]|uniref:Histidine kinase n=1 Tax=Sphingobacterium corticis TaxID=1812823 RepID=A0ABW5NK20_9SPHI
MSFPYFIGIFYATLSIFKRYFLKDKILLGCSAFLMFYVISGAFMYMATSSSPLFEEHFGEYLKESYRFNFREFLQTFLIMHGHFTMLAFLYYQHENELRAIQKQLSEIRLRHDYEYSALAQQISPHMLTNLLQNCIMEIRRGHPTTADQLNDLYRLMNYYTDAHAAGSRKTILISTEIESVKTYLRANQALSDVPYYIDWKITGNINRGSLPPTSMICLVENAIKYGEIGDRNDPLKIQIEIGTSTIYLSIRNRKKRSSPSSISSRGSGLQNLRRRLQIAYPRGHRFLVRDESIYFKVKILIHY